MFSLDFPTTYVVCIISVVGLVTNANTIVRIRSKLDTSRPANALILVDAVVSLISCLAVIPLDVTLTTGHSNAVTCVGYFVFNYLHSWVGAALTAQIAGLRCLLVRPTPVPDVLQKTVVAVSNAIAVAAVVIFLATELINNQPVHILTEVCLHKHVARSTHLPVTIIGFSILAFTIVTIVCDVHVARVLKAQMKAGSHFITEHVVVIPLLATLASSICFLVYMGIMLTALNVTEVSTRAAASVVSIMSMTMAAVRAPLMFRLTFRLVGTTGPQSASGVTALVMGSGSKEKDNAKRKTDEAVPTATVKDPEAQFTAIAPVSSSKEEDVGRKAEDSPAAAKDPEAQG